MLTRRTRWGCELAALLLWTAGVLIQPTFAKADVATSEACRRAGLKAERNLNLPSGLLLAIGAVESGRRDPLSGQTLSWPWTINSDGIGRWFTTLAEALAATRALQAGGTTSIDVGCYQVNLLYHPTAFASLDEAFDPEANANYAARFLLALRARSGGWEEAVAAYHSAASEHSTLYRDHVLAHWSRDPTTAAAAMPHADQAVVWVSGLLLTNQLRIWTPGAPGHAPSHIIIPSVINGLRAPLPTVQTLEVIKK